MSLCGEEAQGTVSIGDASYTLDFSARGKRAAENIMEEESVTLSKVETKVEHECGINQRNKAKMKVGERPVVRLPIYRGRLLAAGVAGIMKSHVDQRPFISYPFVSVVIFPISDPTHLKQEGSLSRAAALDWQLIDL